MADKPSDPEPKRPDKDPPPFPRPPDPIDEPPPDIKPIPPPDIVPPPQQLPHGSLQDEWTARIQRMRSTMVSVPQDTEGHAKVKADITTRLIEFIARHKGHTMTLGQSTDRKELLQVICYAVILGDGQHQAIIITGQKSPSMSIPSSLKNYG